VFLQGLVTWIGEEPIPLGLRSLSDFIYCRKMSAFSQEGTSGSDMHTKISYNYREDYKLAKDEQKEGIVEGSRKIRRRG